MNLHLLLALVACVSPDRGTESRSEGDVARTQVDCLGAGDYPTLQAAIDAAVDGDVIDVAPCTYREHIDFHGKTVTLAALSGPSDTILDGGGTGVVVTARKGERRGTGLTGFTISGGMAAGQGAAVFVDLAKLRLENVVITGSTGASLVYGHSGDLEMSNVVFTGNTISVLTGAAINVFRGSLVASHLTADCTGGHDAIYIGHGSAMIDYATLSCPTGNAVFYLHSTGRLMRSRLDGMMKSDNESGHPEDVVFMENDVFKGGRGIYVHEGMAVVKNSYIEGTLNMATVQAATIEGNVMTGTTCAILADVTTAPFVPAYNDFWAVSSQSCNGAVFVGTNGNFVGDPKFVDAAGGNYTLGAGSACIDAGPDAAVMRDVDGTRNDVGVYGGPKTLAGGW
jgi:hypothetical protein